MFLRILLDPEAADLENHALSTGPAPNQAKRGIISNFSWSPKWLWLGIKSG
jgi:hypothetical protein